MSGAYRRSGFSLTYVAGMAQPHRRLPAKVRLKPDLPSRRKRGDFGEARH
jgi:hypothetical protein